jgi:uncharacterized protein (TIGR01777 family)
MDIAVTGASGLIGSRLVAGLRADGHRVRRLVRHQSGQADEVSWDPSAGTIDAAGLEGIDALVHLAGEGIGERRWSPEQKSRIERSRLAGTALVATTLTRLDRPPRVLISGSGVNYYGEAGDRVLTEASPPGDDFLARLCVRWEAATGPAEAAGIRVAHIRTGPVLARGGGALGRMLPLFRFGLGGRLGSGRQYWSWIALDDEVGAIRWLLEHEVAGPVNLCAPEPATNAELTRALGRVLRRPTVLAVPRFGPRLVLGRELADQLLFTSVRAVPAVLVESGYQFRQPDLESALRAALVSDPG